MDPAYTAAWASDAGDPAALLSLSLMVAGLLVVVGAALLAHYTGRDNLVTRALDRWSS